MVYVTGDLHGDLSRLTSGPAKKLKRKDTLIVLGDFGFLWSGGKKEEKILKKLGKRRYNLLFIDGCHENFDLLRNYPTIDYAGGRAKQISGRLHHLQKGEIYTIEGRRLLCFGGGESQERDSATEGLSWWRAELPTHLEMEDCLARLKAQGNQVDYILTHDAPASLYRFMNQHTDETSWFQNYLDTILQTICYKKWFFARYHKDLVLSSKAVAVYKNLLPLNGPASV